MEFSRLEYWSGYSFPSPGDLPKPGIELRSPALQANSLPAEPQGKPRVSKWEAKWKDSKDIRSSGGNADKTEKAWGCRQTSWFGAAVRSKTSFFLLVLQVQPGTWQWPGRVPAACWWTGSTSYCLNQMQDGILRYWTKRVFCKNAGIMLWNMGQTYQSLEKKKSSQKAASLFLSEDELWGWE